jgi:hypothetical protein
LRRWDAATGKVIEPPLKTNNRSPDFLTFGPVGQTVVLVFGATTTRDISLWLEGAEVAVPLPWKMGNAIDALAFSPDGKTLLTGGNSEVALWDVATARPIGRPMACGERRTECVRFSANGKLIWALGSQANGTGLVQFWETVTGKPTGPPIIFERGLSYGRQTVDVSPDGRLAIIPSREPARDGSRIWDTKSRRPVGPPMRLGVQAVAFSPNGKTVLTHGGASLVLWETATGKPVGTPFHFRSGWKAAFAPDGKTVLVGDVWDDNDERLWQWPITPLEGTPEQILLWAQLLTGMEMDEYGAVRMLDADTWQQRRRKIQQLGNPLHRVRKGKSE